MAEASVRSIHDTAPRFRGQPSVAPGASVEVLSTYSGRWVAGFTVEETDERGVRLRRSSDAAVLPAWFGPSEVRTTTG